ncbi:hypothetical protein [Streptomyces sp. NBC_00503]|uniref:hypothetical protein n=1 Tax=Streptomyces sp. NBC_00503 TaxID=2903659 RepID=UPI002E812972|nr:hypothetical protein [Streptomyces sp. NBC_00503]WUD86291.1 hypothetical protein OG490_11145 [Streptomyces sp. NBC_00503]
MEQCANWFAAWRDLPEEERAVRRSSTVREQRRAPDEIRAVRRHLVQVAGATARGRGRRPWSLG